MQSYAAAAHLAACVYNEQQVHCIFSFSLQSWTVVLCWKWSKRVSAGRSLLCVKCGCTAQQRGRILPFFFFLQFFCLFLAERAAKAVLMAGKQCTLKSVFLQLVIWGLEWAHFLRGTNPLGTLTPPARPAELPGEHGGPSQRCAPLELLPMTGCW